MRPFVGVFDSALRSHRSQIRVTGKIFPIANGYADEISVGSQGIECLIRERWRNCAIKPSRDGKRREGRKLMASLARARQWDVSNLSDDANALRAGPLTPVFNRKEP